MCSFQALTPSPEKCGDKKLVLIVEDSAVIVDMLAWALRLRGYQPVCTANGQEACDWIENAFPRGQYPTAILLDISMPVMDGPTFLQILRTRWKIYIPPIILLTEERRNYDHLACHTVLLKPFHMADLYEQLRLSAE